MKKILLIFSLFFSFQSFAQTTDYSDSSITLTLTQRCTYWIGQYVKTQFTWSERNAPTQLKNYVGSGNVPDSIIASVTFKAKYLLGAMDGIISQPQGVSYSDYRSIVLNQPAVPGYTGLVVQINNKANSGTDPQRFVAQWLKDKYSERTAAYDALYVEQKNAVVEWSKN